MNLLSTPEKTHEKAGKIRYMRNQGMTEEAVTEDVKKYEGRGTQLILKLSHLNPDGRVIQDLDAFDPNTDSGADITKIAAWVGQARRAHPDLTDSHEIELYDYAKKNFGKNGHKFTAESEYEEFVNRVLD